MPTMLSSPNASEKRLTKRSFQRMARRGSLPLKKRRFRLLEATTAEPSAFSLFTPVSSQHPHALSTNGGILPLLQQPPYMDSSSFATAGSLSNSAFASTTTGTIHDTENSASRSNTSTMKSPPAASLTKLSLMAAAAASRSRLRTSEDADASSWVPITAANAQQPVGGAFRKALTKSPTPTTTTTYKPSPGRSPKKKAVSAASSSLMAPLTPGRTQQDKRYTGTGDPAECRCRATTTRGRACAYIAVAPTPYCYLHADYATSPPPPRRYNSSSSSSSSNGSATSKSSSKPTAAPPSLPMVSSHTSSSSSSKPTRRRTSAKLAEKHAAATAPLLSMISTDQWHHKAVRIALGPLTGRTGRVEKWGNGWVSVQLDGTKNGSNAEGGGWHNRRSFELVLLDEGAVTNTSAAAGMETTIRPQTPKIAKEAAVVAVKVTPHSADHPKPNKNVMALQVEHGMVVDLRLPKDTKTKGAALQPRESTTTTASHLVHNDDEEQD